MESISGSLTFRAHHCRLAVLSGCERARLHTNSATQSRGCNAPVAGPNAIDATVASLSHALRCQRLALTAEAAMRTHTLRATQMPISTHCVPRR